MPDWLSITLFLGGAAIAIRVVIAVRRMAHAGRQRSHERRVEREQKRAVRQRMSMTMVKTETGSPSGELAASTVDARGPNHRGDLNLTIPRGDPQ